MSAPIASPLAVAQSSDRRHRVPPHAGVRSTFREHAPFDPTLCPTLPVLEHLHRLVGDVEPSTTGLVGLQHLFGSTASLIVRLACHRIDPGHVFLLGKPYSAHRRVMQFLSDGCGYWVHPESTEQPLDEENDALMDRRIATTLGVVRRRLLADHVRRVVLIDDGGRAIRMLHTDEFAGIRDRFTCVEQTRCGVRTIEDLDLRVPVVNVAESWVKLEHESPMIAESVNRELIRKLTAMKAAGIAIGDRALIIGFGAIGQAVGSELRSHGWRVDVYDTDPDRLAAAHREGYPALRDLHGALRAGGLIVGCTGKPAMDHADYPHIPGGAILVSASSADVEFRAWQLRSVGASLGRPECWGDGGSCGSAPDPEHPCFSLYRIRGGRQSFYLVNGGFPVNFSGDVDPIAPEKIQLTRSLLYLAAVQASYTTGAGLHDLDDALQRLLIDVFASHAGSAAA